MKMLLRKTGVYALCACFILTGCVTSGGSPGSTDTTGPSVGPQLSSLFDPKGPAKVDATKPRLDVIVPVFDPGLSDAGRNYEEEGVWPELRRAEANRFALKLKEALEDTDAFGAVRVTPNASATGDLYVQGKIVESTGEDVEIEIEVTDISGETWFVRRFDHEVSLGFHKNIRNEGLDPYDPVFEAAANRVAHELDDYSVAELENLGRLTELRFGSNFAEEAFAAHLETGRNTVSLLSFPSDSDPMLERTRAVRVRDQLFVDELQDHYRAFSAEMQEAYLIWQEQSLLEFEARREANEKAIGEAALGVLTIGLGVLAVIAGANADTAVGQSAGVTGGVVAGTLGATLLSNSFQTSKEAEIHREALAELGQSIDIDLAPRVIAFNEKTVELSGTAKEQFAQWRAFLQRVFAEERTPDVKL